MEKKWLSFHIFIHDTSFHDEFILNHLYPVIQELFKKGLIYSWFFIRYWEGGPHIRVRLLIDKDETSLMFKNKILDNIKAIPMLSEELSPKLYYKNYLKENFTNKEMENYGWYPDHSMIDQTYFAELERYGGYKVIGESEKLFEISSEIALRIIKATSNRKNRLLVAFDFILIYSLAIYPDPLEAAKWLRNYVFSWKYSEQTPNLNIYETVEYAQKEFHEKQNKYVERSNKIINKLRESENSKKDSIKEIWFSSLNKYNGVLSEALKEDTLANTVGAINMSQMHMFANRIDINPTEECYLCWLVSLSLINTSFRKEFHGDFLHSPDMVYHESSKYVRSLMQYDRPKISKLRGKDDFFYKSKQISLPKPSIDNVNASLWETLQNRRTSYGSYHGQLTINDLGTLLGMSVGEVGTVVKKFNDSKINFEGLRTYPSAGANYSVQLIIYPRNVFDIPRVLYIYNANLHSLVEFAPEPPLEMLLKTSPFLDPSEDPIVKAHDAPLWIFLVGDIFKQREKYGLRAYRLLLMEVGIILENICLVATSLGLNSVIIGGYYDDAVNTLLSQDGIKRSVFGQLILGKLN